jgi:hypothetical protein
LKQNYKHHDRTRYSNIIQTYDGQQEIQPNRGFQDPDFETEMKSVGWVVSDPWCSFLGILGWTKAYTPYPDTLVWANKLFSGNSQQMARNFHADPTWPTSTTTPQIGALCVWGDGDSTISGHTGTVISVDPDGVHFTTEEGNTIPDGNPGNEREGYIVATHTHRIGAPHTDTGLNLIRFILPVEPN